MKKKLIIAVSLFLIILIVDYFTSDIGLLASIASVILLILLSATVGIFSAITFPFPLMDKIAIYIGLAVAIIMFYFGFRKKNKIVGKILLFLGMVIWVFNGFLGVGTYT